MFSNWISTVKRWYTTITAPLQKLFTRTTVDAATLQELRTLLLEADVGLSTCNKILKKLSGTVSTGSDLQRELRDILMQILSQAPIITTPSSGTRVIFLVGINGSGKTTTAAKLAYQARQSGKRVLLVAADTFRAAAIEQLTAWAHQIGAEIMQGTPGSDPSSVIYRGCEAFKTGHYDLLIIDTAGRVQTKLHLMDELAKMARVVHKQLPHERPVTLLTIDSMLGQNSLQQAELFHEATTVDGIILTKFDGTGKGGALFTIADAVRIPIGYVTTGEGLDQIMPFSREKFIDALLGQQQDIAS